MMLEGKQPCKVLFTLTEAINASKQVKASMKSVMMNLQEPVTSHQVVLKLWLSCVGEQRMSMVNNSHSHAVLGSSSKSSVHASHISKPLNFFEDDDDLIEKIDVGQIVEQYQSACTPQPSVSKLPPITPTVENKNIAREDETCFPQELSYNCSHGFKIRLPRSCKSFAVDEG